MRSDLTNNRVKFEQSGDIGASTERSFRVFLREYIPRRLEVGHGEVVDLNGERSKQTDVVIATDDHPFTFKPEEHGLFFIEGVAAAGEVKTILTSAGLKQSLERSAQFKKLRPTPIDGTLRNNSNPSDVGRYYVCPPWFLFAYESQLGLSRIEETIKDSIKGNAAEVNKFLDAVFVLDRGWVVNFGDGEGSFRFITEEGSVARGWMMKESDLVLFDLLAWLNATMPRLIYFRPFLISYLFHQGS